MQYVLDLREIDLTRTAAAGGKGAHLGELSRIDGVRVPPGFVVTTDAFRRVLRDAPSLDDRLDRLAHLDPGDRDAVRTAAAEIRRTVEGIAIPDDLAAAITGALARLGDGTPCAVRSSATTEDQPTASSAGQQDSYLDVVGASEVLAHVSRCWASLFTERAVTYRLHGAVDHRGVGMAVVVQRMVDAQAAGVLFTADPVTGNRRVAAVEAVPGLGDALVSGRVDVDGWTVRDGGIVTRSIAPEPHALRAAPDGGTREQPALTDDQVVALVELGRRIEAHFGHPQDIEWCLDDDCVQIVQSRPITTLFPVPVTDAAGNRVYVSVGHQQMMTDPMTPLGLSVWQLTTPRPMAEAGGRLFADVTPILASPASRAGLLDVVGRSDPLIGDALQNLVARDGFLPPLPDDGPPTAVPGVEPATVETDPDLVTALVRRNEESVAAAERAIRSTSGTALLEFVLADFQELRRILFDPDSTQVIMAGMQASWWLDDHLREWLGETNAADTLTQSVPHNVTSEMGLALLDVADAVRPHPDVVAFLQDVEDDDFLDRMDGLAGGPEARAAIEGYLDRYGARCVGEIDITRPRWSERPTTLLPVLLTDVRNAAAGDGPRRFEQGRQEAQAKEREVLERLHALPDGAAKAADTKRMIDRVRTFAGYREYPKFGMVRRYALYKRALLAEAGRLVRAGVLDDVEDVFFLRLQELHDVVRTQQADLGLVRRRREEFRSYRALTPPRVLTSEGEAVAGAYRRTDLPAGALAGLPVSVGTVEGRARVVLDLADADLEPGDILVTAYTDPSWSPLFVAIAGLVTEVGGRMTHGAVVAREYGLPAVVGVEHATRLIEDGQRIRVDGTAGHVEVLDRDR
ncbi:phosphoenolpyruvate synthase [Pseudonocardia petroleophila]|uniref:Rifampicin phosphotransferase n=1 Tax=Pseudonocardia petroleophila TaxID=37331 RepID=A0A7G7MK39_9PSEU|nr:rifamycin-inactivating phosphotransferase [Pseudonocardia petroleophila]QNG53150.1 phosphoenolpyruvate synthase [Pseudonocardia petroleophila]